MAIKFSEIFHNLINKSVPRKPMRVEDTRSDIPFEYEPREYSESYQKIREEAHKQWPKWKKDYYNKFVAKSDHSKKIQ